MNAPWLTQARKGVLDLIVLAAVRQGEAYGYALLERLQKTPTLAVTESTLYPLLARLASEQLLAVREEPSRTGPPRRYYRITATGKKHLADLARMWQQLTESVTTILNGEDHEPTST